MPKQGRLRYFSKVGDAQWIRSGSQHELRASSVFVGRRLGVDAACSAGGTVKVDVFRPRSVTVWILKGNGRAVECSSGGTFRYALGDTLYVKRVRSHEQPRCQPVAAIRNLVSTYESDVAPPGFFLGAFHVAHQHVAFVHFEGSSQTFRCTTCGSEWKTIKGVAGHYGVRAKSGLHAMQHQTNHLVPVRSVRKGSPEDPKCWRTRLLQAVARGESFVPHLPALSASTLRAQLASIG